MDIKSILVPVDFSNCSASALKYALFLADKFVASVIVLHVINKSHLASVMRISPLSKDETKKQVWLQHKRELEKFLQQNGMANEVESIISEGLPIQENAKKAWELAVD